MQGSQRLLALATVLSSSLLLSCAESTSPSSQGDPVVLGPNTRAITESSLASVESVSTDQARIVVREGTTLAAVHTGDVLVAGVTSLTPAGLLRRVTSIQRENGRIIAITEPARLTDAVKSGRLAFSGTLSSGAQASFSPSIHGVSAHQTAAGEFYARIDSVVLYDRDGDSTTKWDRIVASGEVTVRPRLDFYADIGFFDVDSLYFAYAQTSTLTLSMGAGVSRQLNLEVRPETPSRASGLTVWGARGSR